MLKEEKKLFVVFITPGLFYISFYIIDLLTKFKFSGNHFFNFLWKWINIFLFQTLCFLILYLVFYIQY